MTQQLAFLALGTTFACDLEVLCVKYRIADVASPKAKLAAPRLLSAEPSVPRCLKRTAARSSLSSQGMRWLREWKRIVAICETESTKEINRRADSSSFSILECDMQSQCCRALCQKVPDRLLLFLYQKVGQPPSKQR